MREYRKKNTAYRVNEATRNNSRDRSKVIGELQDQRDKYPFCAWDTEGTNRTATPFLFGSSEGDRLAGVTMSSAGMFDTLLAAERRNPHYIHVVFGGEYDFNMMLKDLPKRYLVMLKKSHRTRWDGYEIEHIPRKWFQVKKDGIVAKIFDVQAFFGTSFLVAIRGNDIGTAEEQAVVQAGKEDRPDFTFANVAEIEPYWRIELKLLVLMMDKLRNAFYDAGVKIRSWHGPGALARMMLTNHKIADAMKVSPNEVLDAARYAFCGGRFESFKAGLHDGTTYNADINSAYPYAATLLPNLAKGYWRHIQSVDRESISATRFVMYKIHYSMDWKQKHARSYMPKSLCWEPQPLFRRFKDDRVMWPNVVTGWYWSPEAELVKDSEFATFLEAWEFVEDDETDRPFEWLQRYYDIRLQMKQTNNPMQITFKLGPNSVFGQTAQRAGWERQGVAPKFHQIEWAGFITSTCRAMIYKAASYCWSQDGLISIDTDGVFASCPIPENILPIPLTSQKAVGTSLGQWSLETSQGILNYQSGVYFMPIPHEHTKTCREPCPYESGKLVWSLKKSRGAPRGKIPYEAATTALPTMADIEYTRNELVGYRSALSYGFDRWRYFIESPRKIQFGGSPMSKRWHQKRACRKCRGFINTDMHDLFPLGNGFESAGNYLSHKHHLPWLDNDHERARDPIELKEDLDPYAEQLMYEMETPHEP